uniref:DUF642 domain-containing protein n=1 Tax=Nelumbo nucifera TaxID=4432 RepID=A0A822YDY2_NELNU|nr:TPA_asm: hypothetical protein HUJ06_009433 [Nelumbo nucifera]
MAAVMLSLLLRLVLFPLMASAADLLRNPDFESPPLNITAGPNTPLVQLTKANTIPGWTFNGTVSYATSGGNGHGIQLGRDGKINQTFRASDNFYYYVLTFTLAPGIGDNCSQSTAFVNVSVPGSSRLFYLKNRYGKEKWESHSCHLGGWGVSEFDNLVIRSQFNHSGSNATCGPVVDTFILKGIETPKYFEDNILPNGGFEVGPAFLNNSTEGILLDEDPDESWSVLQDWSVMGTVKYIDRKHYGVPQGQAAIEIVSGAPSGIKTVQRLQQGADYSLTFMMGDAKDSCVGELIVWAQAGNTIQNFTMRSDGTGSVRNCSLTFKADSSLTPISFVNFNESRNRELLPCGPVIDDVVLLRTSASEGIQRKQFTISCFVFLFLVIL